MQFFKDSDAEEKKFYNAASPALSEIDLGRNQFFNEAYECFRLGDVLHVTGRAPLVNAMRREIFRQSFMVIFEAFIRAGSYESYLTVFRNIFGEDVDVEFNSDLPGTLNIDIHADGFQLSRFITRYIVDNEYLFDNIVTQEGDNIVFQTIAGFESQYELELMLFEMVPDGIYTVITLTLGD